MRDGNCSKRSAYVEQPYPGLPRIRRKNGRVGEGYELDLVFQVLIPARRKSKRWKEGRKGKEDKAEGGEVEVSSSSR